MSILSELFVKISGDNSSYKKALKDSQADTAAFEASQEASANRLSAIGGRLLGGIGFGAIGAGALAAASKFDEAFTQIQRSTGATGEKLEGLKASFNEVYKNTSTGSEQVAAAMSNISARTGASGAALEDLTLKMIKLGKTQREDVTAIAPLVTRVFGDWSIAATNTGHAMDFLRVVSQQTGTRVAAISEVLVYAGAPLRALGYDFESAATMIGKFEKEGVNTQLVLGGMKAILGKFAKEGVADTAAAWQDFIEKVRSGNIGLSQIAQTAGEFGVGRRAAVDLFRAIQEGRFNIDDTTKSYRTMADVVVKDTETMKGQVIKWTHSLEELVAGHYQLITVIGLTYPAWSRIGGLVLPMISGWVGAMIGGGGAVTAVNALTGSTYALGGAWTATGTAANAALGSAGVAGTAATLLKTLGAIGLAIGAIIAGLKLLDIGHSGDNPTGTLSDSERRALAISGGQGAIDRAQAAVTARAGQQPATAGPSASAYAVPVPASLNAGGGLGPAALTDAQYRLQASEIDAYAAHQKALLDLRRTALLEEKVLDTQAAQDRFALLEGANQKELRITLAAIDQKIALEKQKNDDQKDVTLGAQRQAAIDAAAKKSLELRHDLAIEEEKIDAQSLAMKRDLSEATVKLYNENSKRWNSIILGPAEADLKLSEAVAKHVNTLNLAIRKDEERASQEEESGEEQHQTRLIELKRKAADFAYSQGTISAKQRLAIEKDLDAQEIEIQRKAIQRMIDLLDAEDWIDTDRLAKRQALINALKALEDKNAENEQKAAQASIASAYNVSRELSNATHQSFDAIYRGFGDLVVNGGKAFDKLKEIGKNFASDLFSIMLKGLFKPLEDQIAKLVGNLGSVFGSAAGGAGGVSSAAGSAGSAGSGASSAASGLGGIGGVISVVSGAVTAISSVVGNFQMAGMNKSLDVLVNHTLRIFNVVYQDQQEHWAFKSQLFAKMDDMWHAILDKGDLIAGRIGTGGSGGGSLVTFNNCSFSGGADPNAVMAAAFKQFNLAQGK